MCPRLYCKKFQFVTVRTTTVLSREVVHIISWQVIWAYSASRLSVKVDTHLHSDIESSGTSITSLNIRFSNRYLIDRCRSVGLEVFEGSSSTTFFAEGDLFGPNFHLLVQTRTKEHGTVPFCVSCCMCLIKFTEINNTVDQLCFRIPYLVWWEATVVSHNEFLWRNGEIRRTQLRTWSFVFFIIRSVRFFEKSHQPFLLLPGYNFRFDFLFTKFVVRYISEPNFFGGRELSPHQPLLLRRLHRPLKFFCNYFFREWRYEITRDTLLRHIRLFNKKPCGVVFR